MGEMLELNRTQLVEESGFSFPSGDLNPTDYGRMGEMIEHLRQKGFAQIAYLAADYLAFGEVRPSTLTRAENELSGKALESLGEPFITSFYYKIDNNQLVAEDGEPIEELNLRGWHQALEAARLNPKLEFVAKRREADVENIKLIAKMATDDDIPVGTTLLVKSACPEKSELGISQKLLEDLNYQPEVDQAMVWCATKTNDGIIFKTLNLFHAPPEALSTVTEKISKQRQPDLSREETPHHRTLIPPGTSDVAELFRDEFDAHMTLVKGFATFHGMNLKEYKGFGSEIILQHPEFLLAQRVTMDVFDTAAQSLVENNLKVDRNYLQALLEMRKPNGEFELAGVRRKNVMLALNTKLNSIQLEDVIKTVYVAGSSALWATLTKLYYNSDRTQKELLAKQPDTEFYPGAVHAASLLLGIREIRASGRVERGCAGSGDIEKSLFDMTDSERIDTMTERGAWKWKKGVCRIKNCYTRPGQTEVGPCDVCRSCQRSFDNGKDPSKQGSFIENREKTVVSALSVWLEKRSKSKSNRDTSVQIKKQDELQNLKMNSKQTNYNHETIAA